ncbi:MAG: hypothetical protein QXW97_00935 [Candidatus Pacearchaeota archaeon]
MFIKYLFLIITCFFIINSVISLELSISPGNLNFSGNVSQRICKEIFIKTSYAGNILGETKWIKKFNKKRDIGEYNLKPEDLNLIIDYPSKIKSDGISLKKEICITANKSGEYYGAITYKTQEGYAGVGSWIYVNIEKEQKNYKNSIEKITGMSILLENNSKNFDKKIFLYIITCILIMLMIFLIILLFIKKNLK